MSAFIEEQRKQKTLSFLDKFVLKDPKVTVQLLQKFKRQTVTEPN